MSSLHLVNLTRVFNFLQIFKKFYFLFPSVGKGRLKNRFNYYCSIVSQMLKFLRRRVLSNISMNCKRMSSDATSTSEGPVTAHIREKLTKFFNVCFLFEL